MMWCELHYSTATHAHPRTALQAAIAKKASEELAEARAKRKIEEAAGVRRPRWTARGKKKPDAVTLKNRAFNRGEG